MIQYLIPILLCLGCAQVGGYSDRDSTIEPKKSTWKTPELTGQWKLEKTTIVKDIPFLDNNGKLDERLGDIEEGPFEYYRSGSLIFDRDTMYRIDYPMEVIVQSAYSIDSGYIHWSEAYKTHAYPTELVDDTLFIYVPGTYGEEYLKEAYVKTTFNDSLINLLKRHGANYPELAGTWVLKRDYYYDYGTHYRLQFPYDLPDSIEISKEQFAKAQKRNNSYLIKTDGKKRAYFFEYRWPYLHFIPGKWYKGEDPLIHYERKEPDN